MYIWLHDLNSRKELSISECYFLLNKPWMRFFKQYIFPSSITVFDVSHGYYTKPILIVEIQVINHSGVARNFSLRGDF